MSNIITDLYWPILFFVPANANIVVFFHGEGVSRYLTNLLLNMGICAFLYVNNVLPLLWCFVLLFGLLLLAYAVEKLIILLRRSNYGEV